MDAIPQPVDQGQGESASARIARPGVYAILNVENGKRYVGSSKNIADRLASHRWALFGDRHHSRKLQHAWRKYGAASFVFQPLLVCSERDLTLYEQRAIDAFNAVKGGYNIFPFARSAAGFRHSKESKAKLSLAHTGKRMSEASRAKMRARMIGYKPSEATRAKIAATLRGIKRSAESIAKRVAHGVSEETRRKISATLVGHSVSAASRIKMSASQKRRFARSVNG